ncbi:MAG: sigma-54 dependent transcriptional regulator [Bacteroidales bacterium]|nr:sigma-54 dependent transcriptional regulator [Bacteroidales bacterium]
MEINLPDISPEVQQAKLRFGIVGNAPSLLAAINRAIQVAPIDLSVLITGESGSGKEFFPQIIHSFSARKHSKYIAVNCGAIPEGTIDSELFGHEKGSFTGAVGSRKGYFEEADGGTIFLDEVAELPLTTQARLLRVLESGEFIKVGSSTVQRTNIRVVAATNVDMLKAVEEGRFREDLFYRLSTVHISIPPLRDRGSDITMLARKFASDFAERYRMPSMTLDDSAQRLLQRYRWPGNVRQLKNVIEQMALFEAGSQLTADDLEQYLPAHSAVYTPTVTGQAGEDGYNYNRERELIFNMIFRMQREIDSLRDALQKTQHDGPRQATDVAPSRSLMKYQAPEETESIFHPHRTIDVSPEETTDAPTPEADPHHHVKTLEETERDTIRRSLENNGGRRKLTAQELNISERTLYRKIKEYGLDL